MTKAPSRSAAIAAARYAWHQFRREASEWSAPLVWLQYSGVPYVELEGQRPLRLANEAIKQQIPTIYVALDRSGRVAARRIHPFLLVMTSGALHELQTEIFASPLPGRKVLCLHFPHPDCAGFLPLARAQGWLTIYDCMDSWREFHPLGQAHWFSEAAEALVCRSADLVVATNPTLGAELRRFGVEQPVIIPNGVDPDRLDRSLPPLRLPQGEITIGFFGYITRAWFDWDRLVRLARRRPRWLFPIIWWGEAWPSRLPPNIISLGAVPHVDLPRYTAGWDVGLVNFRNIPLVFASCPIKVYEYLHLRLPVVSAAIPHLRDYPYVYTAESVEDFERQILRAAGTRPERPVLDAVVRAHTWTALFNRFLAAIRAAAPGGQP